MSGSPTSERPRRVVSLVPSLTEAVAATAPDLLVGATDWCTHPTDLDVSRVGGTKWPDIAAVLALRPDLVVANQEENRAEDVAALRSAGLDVWVCFPRTVPAALDALDELCGRLGAGTPHWLRAAREAWAAARRTGTLLRAVVPIWRRPWMVLGHDTFAADVLHRLGVDVLFDGRYPKLPLDELRAAEPDLVVLPDEPYRFTAEDGPDAFPDSPYALVSGRHLTWYGPSLLDAPTLLAAQVAAATRR